MKKQLLAIVISVFIAVALLAADPSGSWAFSSDLLPPDLTCAFAAKDTTLYGTCSAGKTTFPISDARVTGRMVRWTVNVPSDTGVTTAYTFAGDMDEDATLLTGTLTISNVTGTERGMFTALRK